MYRNNDFIYDAAVQLENLTNFPVTIESNRAEYDAILTIKELQFTVVAKAELRKANKGLVLAQLNEIENKSTRPVLIVSKFIASDIAQELKEKSINYLDIAGNTFIKKDDLILFITGQKARKIEKTNQTRAFQETGLKLIFSLLTNPDNLQLSYRELAEKTDIAIGSVSIVMKELEEQNFILKTETKRVLKNKTELLNRWIVGYNDVLRPKLLKKRMRFTIENSNNWDTLPIHEVEGIFLWGGEPAAALLTGKINPLEFIIYTNTTWQNLIRPLGLKPDDKGDVEIMQIFWQEVDKYRERPVVPALLVYADLISSGIGRNSEIAKTILENELNYLQ
ncbi:MAG: type IV toxin-antitoxin system AbiEi family antitoxin [Breznakibacter sp.]